MKYNPRRIGLVGVLGDLPTLAKAANQTFKIGLIPHGTRPTERPLDRACRSPKAFSGKQCRKQAVAGRVADADILGRRWKILDDAGRLARRNSDRVRDPVRRKSQQFCARGPSSKNSPR